MASGMNYPVVIYFTVVLFSPNVLQLAKGLVLYSSKLCFQPAEFDNDPSARSKGLLFE